MCKLGLGLGLGLNKGINYHLFSLGQTVCSCFLVPGCSDQANPQPQPLVKVIAGLT